MSRQRRIGAPVGSTSTVNTPMPSLMMERGKQKWQSCLANGSGTGYTGAGQICFSCEQIFVNRKCLEEHVCSSASYICSCGTEFSHYKDMLEHSTSHEPGQQVLDHETIRKRRVEKRKEEDEKLKRLEKGEVVWKAPKLDSVPSVSSPVTPVLQFPNTSAHKSEVPMQSAQISQVPVLHPSLLQASLLSNPLAKDMQNIFAGVGAPTVDLWTLYQPVVLLQMPGTVNTNKQYTCGKCGQSFMTKTSLISHHSSHVTDKVSGCIGCGLLLSSKKVVPRFHVCDSPNNATKFRLITARPANYKRPNAVSTDRTHSLGAQRPQATSLLQLKNQNRNAASKGGQVPHVTSTLQLKNLKMRPYKTNNQRLHATPSLQFKSQHASAYKSFTGGSFPSKSQSPNSRVSNQSGRGLPVIPSASGLLSKLAQTASSPNGFTCRVCHIAFGTPQLLQRHKCVKAQEFMAQHVRSGRPHYKLNRMTPVASPNPAQMNGDRQLGFLPSGSIEKNKVVADRLDNRPKEVPVNGTTVVDSDDDCYIVESGPDKPAEMIYQVTSSVPIET